MESMISFYIVRYLENNLLNDRHYELLRHTGYMLVFYQNDGVILFIALARVSNIWEYGIRKFISIYLLDYKMKINSDIPHDSFLSLTLFLIFWMILFTALSIQYTLTQTIDKCGLNKWLGLIIIFIYYFYFYHFITWSI